MAQFTLIILLAVTLLTAIAGLLVLWSCLREPRTGRSEPTE